MTTARLTVFVQAWNTEPFIGECLESVLTLRGGDDIEVFVIDDASTDRTCEEIARIRDRRLRVIRHERNAGATATANEGYALGTAPFIVRLDSDDRLKPNFVLDVLAPLELDPRLGFAYGDVATIDSEGLETGQTALERQGRPARGNELFPLLVENFLPAPSTIVRRAAVAPLLPIPAHFRFLDWYISTGIAEQWDSLYVGSVVADYRIHGANMHRSMILDRSGEATSLDVIDRLFARDVRRPEKDEWRRRVYSAHYLTYANKYFGCRMNADAQRCYREAIAHEPSALLDAGVLRRFAATIVGRDVYEWTKIVAARRSHS